MTAEKNKLFFTICTPFVGNHTDETIIIIKVWGLGSNSTELSSPFFLLQMLHERDQQAPIRHAQLPCLPFLSFHICVRPQLSSSFFFNFHCTLLPTHHTRITRLRDTHTWAESSRVPATKARDTPKRQHCSVTLGERGRSPSLYLACSKWQRLRCTRH